ncbi:DNA translocase FtsK-like [Atheta coriaria]|uniref:DNA translocase FtsK-like n=1 Tax=Dalotia coriaria TaxID=877792 RepID=UPI0031F447A6
MYRLFVVLALLGASTAQNQYNKNPQTAQILAEQRYLSGDGKFGAQYSQEDGVEFKEESDADGTRHGSYSYVDPSGQRRTVTYTAGKNGFQATGDHLPQAPAAPVPTPPAPQYQPLPQYNSPTYQQPQYQQPQYQQPQYQQPQYNPQQYQQYQQPAQPQYTPQYQQQAAYQQPQYQQPAAQPQYQQYQQTTQAPHRFYPPGKLNLNRSPDGFTYSFQKA